MAVLTHSPMLGAPTDTSMRVWVRTNQAASVLIQYQPAGAGWGSPSETAAHSMISGEDFTHVFSITGLSANAVYDYRPKVDGTPDTGNASTLKTLKTAGLPATFSFAFGSCLVNDGPHPMFDTVAAHNPDFALLLGDMIYADGNPPSPAYNPATEAEFWTVYQNGRSSQLQSFGKSIPLNVVWDDHDYGINDGDSTYALRAVSRAAFGKYWPNPNYEEASASIYYKFTVADCEFFMLDSRYNRGAAGTSMLGATQLAWLKAALSASTAVFKFVVSPVMINLFGTTTNDSWFGYQAERADIFNYIATNALKNVIFLTGDQHWSGNFLNSYAVYQHGQKASGFYECSPGPLDHINHRTKTTSSDSQILFKGDSDTYYGLVSVDTTAHPKTVTLSIRKGTGGSLAHAFTVEEFYVQQSRRRMRAV